MSADDPMPDNEIEEIPESEISADEDMEDDEMDMSELDMGMDLGALLATEDGDTVCSALVDAANGVTEIAKQLATQNKILIKILAKLT